MLADLMLQPSENNDEVPVFPSLFGGVTLLSSCQNKQNCRSCESISPAPLKDEELMRKKIRTGPEFYTLCVSGAFTLLFPVQT